MRIAVISDMDDIGGAAQVARRLAGAWGRSHEVRRFVGYRFCSPGCVCYSVTKGSGLVRGLGMESSPAADRIYGSLRGRRLLREVESFAPDIISMHDIHHFPFPLEVVESLGKIAPIAWTLHNMWSFTGGCAFSHECNLYATGCREPCPQKYCRPASDVRDVAGRWLETRNIIKLSSVHAIVPSAWLGDRAREGGWPDDRLHVVPNGVDTEVFAPVPLASARDTLRIPRDKRCVMFAAVSPLKDKRKGYTYLDEALTQLRSRMSIFELVVGSDFERRDGDRLMMRFAKSETILGAFYGAADCFVLPSTAENAPLVLLEALAMGTPCVAFAVGGNPEIVRPGETGFLAEKVAHGDLAASIEQVLALPEDKRIDMRHNCRLIVEEEYSLGRQSERYLELFDNLPAKGG